MVPHLPPPVACPGWFHAAPLYRLQAFTSGAYAFCRCATRCRAFALYASFSRRWKKAFVACACNALCCTYG